MVVMDWWWCGGSVVGRGMIRHRPWAEILRIAWAKVPA